MINLLFDFNNMVFRSLYIISNYSNKYTFDAQSEIDQLMRKIAMDISFIIRLINPSRIIFTIDSKSWRRNINIEENDGYKAQRSKSKIINWDNIYKTLTDFTDIMESQGMIVTKIEDAESDDLLACWRDELLFTQQQHVVIVSGDEDVRQLVQFYPTDSKKMVFSTVFNPFMQGKNASRKLYVPKYFEQWINEVTAADIFNMKGSIDVDKEDFKKIISAERTKTEYVDGRMIALRKIFCGDDGDNIPAFYTWLNDKGKEERLTNSKFVKIYDSMVLSPDEQMDYEDLWDRRDKLLEVIKTVLKRTPPFKIEDRLKRQFSLVVLSPILFPEKIQQDFENLKEKELAKPKVNYASINMHNLLEGTRYVNERKTSGTESNIFREMDKMTGKSLF